MRIMVVDDFVFACALFLGLMVGFCVLSWVGMMTGKMRMETVEMVRIRMMSWSLQSNGDLCVIMHGVVPFERGDWSLLTVVIGDGVLSQGMILAE